MITSCRNSQMDRLNIHHRKLRSAAVLPVLLSYTKDVKTSNKSFQVLMLGKVVLSSD